MSPINTYSKKFVNIFFGNELCDLFFSEKRGSVRRAFDVRIYERVATTTSEITLLNVYIKSETNQFRNTKITVANSLYLLLSIGIENFEEKI